MSSGNRTGTKRIREEAAQPSLEQAEDSSISATEALDAVVPMSPFADWLIMFENGPWIKSALEKVNRILPDVGVFSVDYVIHEIEDGHNAPVTMAYFFLTLCQELKERNGFVQLQYPLHHARISEKYVEGQKALLGPDKDVEMPKFACIISHILGALRNSVDRTAIDVAEAPGETASHAKLVTLTLETRPGAVTPLFVIKPLSNNPFKDGPSKAKRAQQSMFAEISLQTLFEEYTKSHASVDRSTYSAMKHYFSQVNFGDIDFLWSVHNLSQADMHHTLTKTVVTKQAPREFVGAQAAALVDGDILARFRLFYMDMPDSDSQKVLIFNIQVMNQNSPYMYEVRYPTIVKTLTQDEKDREARQEVGGAVSVQMSNALLRRTRFVKVEAPLLDEDYLSTYDPPKERVVFDEYFTARSLAPMFAQGGSESFTLYFGYRKGDMRAVGEDRSKVPGLMLVDVNRVAVDERVAYLLILVNPLDTRVHESLSRTSGAAFHKNPFE